MKRIIIMGIALAISASSSAQTITATSSASRNFGSGGNRPAWTVQTSTASVSLDQANSSSDYIYFSGFNLSKLPNTTYITAMSVTITRSSSGMVVDSAVRLVLNGAVYYDNDINAASNPSTWGSGSLNYLYTFPPDKIEFLKGSDLKNAGFGIAMSVYSTKKTGTASIGNIATLTVSYLTLAPIVLTDFTVSKNADNHVDIRFATSTEENVRQIFIERSGDGKKFDKLFTFQPSGAQNVYTRYSAVDMSPLSGNNYYRISELDKDNRMSYYTTKLINMSAISKAFSAYFDGSRIITNLTGTRGQYEISLIDLAGMTITRKQINISGPSTLVTLDAPSRTGIYIITVKGEGSSESIRVPVKR